MDVSCCVYICCVAAVSRIHMCMYAHFLSVNLSLLVLAVSPHITAGFCIRYTNISNPILWYFDTIIIIDPLSFMLSACNFQDVNSE